jgi:hypothetical protein
MLDVETHTQFLARMLVSTREGQQITSKDAQRLSDLAQYGPGPIPTTMPEERRDANRIQEPAESPREVIQD